MLIRHLPLKEDSYEKAWSLLMNRYDNERAIIDSNIKQVVELPILSTESADGLKNMLNTVNGCIAAINSFKINTETWDCILIFLLRQRLDANNIKLWEESLKGTKKVPPFKRFVEFLETRINILETTSMIQPTIKMANEKGQKVFFTTTKISKKCTICKQEHFAFNCPQLKTLSAIQRPEFIVRKGLCTNCLYPHKLEECQSRFTCRHCSQKHHTALHPPVQINNINTEEGSNDSEPELEPDEEQALEMQHAVVAHVDQKLTNCPVKLATGAN